MAVLVDTSALLAFVDENDRRHRDVRQYIEHSYEPLLLPVMALPEVDYWVSTRFGIRVELAMLRYLAAGGFSIQQLTEADLERSIELIEQYSGSDIGLVDASIVAMAERMRITRILTLDHRHFAMFRPRHCEAFELVP